KILRSTGWRLPFLISISSSVGTSTWKILSPMSIDWMRCSRLVFTLFSYPEYVWMTYQRRPSSDGCAAAGSAGASGSSAGASTGSTASGSTSATAQAVLGLVDRDLFVGLHGAEERARGLGRGLVRELRGVDLLALRCLALGRRLGLPLVLPL